jgi:hypothetical protein
VESGPNAIIELQKTCSYAVTLAGKEVFTTDCTRGADADPAATFPWIMQPVLIYRGSTDFNEIVVLPQLMTGNACPGGVLRFLGIGPPGAPAKVVVSDIVYNCSGEPSPEFTVGPHRIRVSWPDTTEAWVYKGGQVHRIVGTRSAAPVKHK